MESLDGGRPSPRDGMTIEDLADAVERSAPATSISSLQQATGLSARTVRDILSARPGRRYGRATLSKLDSPLGWEPGTAWRLYRDGEEPDVDERTVQIIAGQMEQIVARVAMLEEQPTWAGEVLDAFRPLRAEDRATLLALARRLAGPR